MKICLARYISAQIESPADIQRYFKAPFDMDMQMMYSQGARVAALIKEIL